MFSLSPASEDVEENEKEILKDAFGVKWYERWGFVEKDLYEIFTIKS